jgi:catalase-peroxidase
MDTSSSSAKCPYTSDRVVAAAGSGKTNKDWWPESVKLNILRQHNEKVSPMDADFDYAKEFMTLDLAAVKGPRGPDDRLAGLVARRLRTLRPLLY